MGGASSLEVEQRGDGNATTAELQSLVLELSGEVQLVGRAVQTVAESQTPGPDVTACISQLAGLRGNVDKCLSYHEEGACARVVSSTASTVGLERSVLSLEGLLIDLRRDVQMLSQRPMSAIRARPSSHPDLTEKTPLHWEVGSSLD